MTIKETLSNVRGDSSEEQPTELVMQKDGERVEIWVVIDGEQVFHAVPTAKMSKRSIAAAVTTFLSRAFKTMVDSDDAPHNGGFM